MPKNISPRYKKNYKGTNKTWGLCQCEKWRCRSSACSPACLSSFSIQGLWGVALQSCTCAPRILELQRQDGDGAVVQYVSGREKKREGWKGKVGQGRLIGGIGDSNQAQNTVSAKSHASGPVLRFRSTCRRVTSLLMLYITRVQLNTSDRK